MGYITVFLPSFVPLSGSPNSHVFLKRFGIGLHQTYRKSNFDLCEPKEICVSRE